MTLLFTAGKGSGAIQSLGFVWAALRRAFPEGFTDFRSDGMDNVRGMTLTADSSGAVFDVRVNQNDGKAANAASSSSSSSASSASSSSSSSAT